jgi:hypothetical protein
MPKAGQFGSEGGPAILYREYFEFADARYERLANISVAHIYNLRKHGSYREKRMTFQTTRRTPVSNRRAPPARTRKAARLSAN